MAAICAASFIIVACLSGLPAAIGLAAIVAVLTIGLALQDALAWLAVKGFEGALRFVFPASVTAVDASPEPKAA